MSCYRKPDQEYRRRPRARHDRNKPSRIENNLVLDCADDEMYVVIIIIEKEKRSTCRVEFEVRLTCDIYHLPSVLNSSQLIRIK